MCNSISLPDALVPSRSERNEPCFCPRCLSHFLKRASGRQQQPWLVETICWASSPGVSVCRHNLHERRKRKLKRPPEAPGLDQTKKCFLIMVYWSVSLFFFY
ncbi:hypothetical protein TNIN_299501 [Trichonephila inaurata madagascariensis]|uniref:Uncharacterized protein n=1 Tax=Trichonephila inaurata madagascariensis TaxID=2747483 RepID=A0A8X6XQ63_9ARAC|nr:hypothetical protein TNIN_299501 [Trichonephila inaurata madagascariensis]